MADPARLIPSKQELFPQLQFLTVPNRYAGKHDDLTVRFVSPVPSWCVAVLAVTHRFYLRAEFSA